MPYQALNKRNTSSLSSETNLYAYVVPSFGTKPPHATVVMLWSSVSEVWSEAGYVSYLFRLAFVISFRNAGPSSGFSNSKAHNRSSETLEGNVSDAQPRTKAGLLTSCKLRNCQILNRTFVSNHMQEAR